MTTTTGSSPAGSSMPRAVTTRSQQPIWRAIFARAVADRRTIVTVLAFYALAIGVGVGALWPPLKTTFADIADSFPAAFDGLLGGVSLATPAGWVNAEMLSMMGPAFLIATAILSASAATAGEEQARTLGLVLSTSASRTTFVAAKAAAVVVHVMIVAVAMFAGLALGNLVGDLGLPVTGLLAATVSMTLLGLLYGAIALTVGTITGDKRLTMAITAGIAGLSFVLSVFLPLADSLKTLAKVNFWYPYSANVALVNGIDWGFAAVLAGFTVLIGAIAFLVLPRRDLRG